MGKCIACDQTGDRTIKALKVRTLHVRDLQGERRVQALGGFVNASVCNDCTAKKLALETDPIAMARPQLLIFGTILLIGAVLEIVTFTLLSGQRVFAVLGIAAILCGVLGIIGNMRDSKEKSKEMSRLSPEDALEEAAWDVFLQHAPRKEGEEHITYIPCNQRTLARKNGDLMILYHLLPEIAKQAYQRIHSEADHSDEE